MFLFTGALAFAELGTVVVRSGAEYAYFLEAFGPLHKFWGPVPSFICCWVYVIALRPAEVAVIILTFAEYCVQPVLDALEIGGQQDQAKKLVAILALGESEFGVFAEAVLMFACLFQVSSRTSTYAV